MARPLKVIDWNVVDKLCGIQATAEEIAQFLGIDADTLATACKREQNMTFSDYFSQKRGSGKVSLRRAQWQAAQDGNPALLIWLGKQYLGQKDKSAHEISGPDGRMITTTIIDLGRVPTERLELIEEALNAATVEATGDLPGSSQKGARAPQLEQVLQDSEPGVRSELAPQPDLLLPPETL